MMMENQILLDITSLIDSGLVTEIFTHNSPVCDENFDLATTVINNPTEEGLLASQDNDLYTVNVGEALLDHFNYPLTIENQKTIVKVEVHPLGNNSCHDEDLEKYKEINLPEAEHMPSPYLPSDDVHFLSSVAMQHKNCSVPTSSIFSPEGAVNQNVRMIAVFRSFIAPAPECSSDTCGLPQTSASAYSESAEVGETVTYVTENHQDRAIFQSSNVDESGCTLLALHSVAEEPRCSYRSDSNPVVMCQLEGGVQMLCYGTPELEAVHLIADYQKQQHGLQSDVDNPVTAVFGQLLPVPTELLLNEQEFENEPLQPVASTSTFHPESDQHGTVKVTSEGLPFGSGGTKSREPYNCRKLQPAACISWEEVKVLCACLLMQAEEAEKRGYSLYLAEQMIMEEFGRYLSQILHAKLKPKGLEAE